MRLGRLSFAQRLIVLALALAAAAPAAARDEARVLVVPVHGAAGKGFDAAVDRLVGRPLKRHATVLPQAAARPALKRAHVGLKALRQPRAVQKVGRAARAAFVLVVEAGGKKPHLVANATLVDVASGQTLFSERYALVGGKLTAEVAAQMLSPVADKLTGDAGGGGDAQADAAAPSDAGDGKKKKKGGKFAFPSGAGDKSAEGEDGAATAEKGDGDAAGDATGDAADGEARPKTAHGPRWRPGLRLALGATFERRTGTLVGPLPPNITRLPCYCGEGNATNPFYPGVQLHAEVFPWALGGSGESWLEGLGLEVELFATQIKSYISYYAADGTLAKPKSVVSSLVLDVRANLAFRYVFWNSVLAPDLEAQLGLSVFSFPLHNGTFPGVAYTAPALGLRAHVPVGIEQLALIGSFTFMPTVLAGDDAGDKVNLMLGTQAGGTGFSGGGGMRFAFDNYEIHGLIRYEAYSLKYTGQTHLALGDNAAETQLNNIGLKDGLLQYTVTVGMVF